MDDKEFNGYDFDNYKARRKMKFEYEYLENMEDVIKNIRYCEGRHTQQAIFSTFHTALTQICFDCKKIRSNIER